MENKWPKPGDVWTNSLGLKFVPAGTDAVLFCIYDVRVQDYKAFIDATAHDMSGGVYVQQFEKNANGGYGFTFMDTKARWDKLGFEQGPTHPVVGVSWNDAEAFCQWLTEKERAAGLLGPAQSYRLPSDEEVERRCRS